jgi:hypothetical protein
VAPSIVTPTAAIVTEASFAWPVLVSRAAGMAELRAEGALAVAATSRTPRTGDEHAGRATIAARQRTAAETLAGG